MASISPREQVELAARPLIDRMQMAIDKGMAEGRLTATRSPVLRFHLVSPGLTESGPEIGQTEGEYTEEMDFSSAKLEVVNGTHDWAELAAMEVALGRVSTGGRSLSEWILLQSAEALLKDPKRPSAGVSRVLDQAASVLESPASIMLEGLVELRGVKVASGGLVIETPNSRITLRRPEIGDLEGMAYRLRIGPTMQREPAVWEIQALATIRGPLGEGENLLPSEARRLESLLRLAAVTGAKFGRLQMRTVSPLEDYLGDMNAGEGDVPREVAVLHETDLPVLQAIASELWSQLPTDFPLGEEPAPSPTTTAYRRYTDALMRDGHLVERRIASAVMGLEALYLLDDNSGELSYRLRTSVANAMGALGADSAIVLRQVRMGYGIRSRYVHGGHLSAKEADKTFGGVGSLLHSVQDYLRRSIVLHLVLAVPKDAFVSALQAAVVSSRGRTALEEMVRPAIRFVGFTRCGTAHSSRSTLDRAGRR